MHFASGDNITKWNMYGYRFELPDVNQALADRLPHINVTVFAFTGRLILNTFIP
jgi:hypothetical protein